LATTFRRHFQQPARFFDKNCIAVPVVFTPENSKFTVPAHKTHHICARRYSCPTDEQNSAFEQLTGASQYK
jgi:hypothetical protein